MFWRGKELNERTLTCGSSTAAILLPSYSCLLMSRLCVSQFEDVWENFISFIVWRWFYMHKYVHGVCVIGQVCMLSCCRSTLNVTLKCSQKRSADTTHPLCGCVKVPAAVSEHPPWLQGVHPTSLLTLLAASG